MNNESEWQEELTLLKSIIQKTGLTKAIKWGGEVYMHNNKNVVSCGGFKKFFTLWFYDGVFLNDPYEVLHTASGGTTKALRQWRFTRKEEIDEQRILAYIGEAIQNVEKGKVWIPEKSKLLEVPASMRVAFKEDPTLEDAFIKLTPYKQKEYIEYINLAKRAETKLTRLHKIKPMILAGTGLNDTYRNC